MRRSDGCHSTFKCMRGQEIVGLDCSGFIARMQIFNVKEEYHESGVSKDGSV